MFDARGQLQDTLHHGVATCSRLLDTTTPTLSANYSYVVADDNQDRPTGQSSGLRVKANLMPISPLLDEEGQPRDGACLVRLRLLAGSGEVLKALATVDADGNRSPPAQSPGLPRGYEVVAGSGDSVDQVFAPEVDM